MATNVLTATQQADLTLVIKDKKGNAVTPENVEWASSNSEVVAVADVDGKKVAVAGAVGTGVTVSATGDADMGAGVAPFTATADFDVVPGVGTQFELQVGTPTEQPEAPPAPPTPPGQ